MEEWESVIRSMVEAIYSQQRRERRIEKVSSQETTSAIVLDARR